MGASGSGGKPLASADGHGDGEAAGVVLLLEASSRNMSPFAPFPCLGESLPFHFSRRWHCDVVPFFGGVFVGTAGVVVEQSVC